MIRVAVLGAAGKMGSTVCGAVRAADGLELAATYDSGAAERESVVVADLEELSSLRVDVAVDFTTAKSALANAKTCLASGIHTVIGTTGLRDDDLVELGAAVGPANCIVAPNFAIGAVLMMQFAKLAAPFFESAEIVEIHHNKKVDTPSGTALRTAKLMQEASETWIDDPTEAVTMPGSRGARLGDIPIHSLRLVGSVAHQEVVLGTTGQTLTIRHDSLDRMSFMPGVLLAVRKVGETPGLTVGLEHVIDLPGVV